MRRGRFAPTPSGNLHIGNIAAALLAWLHIRQAGGEFILRMEDIDRPRCRQSYADSILADLRWIGIDWDEGPDVGGRFAPYVQSERIASFDAALRILQEKDIVYPCFCSRAQLMSLASAPHGLESEGPVYPGTCRHLPPDEQQAKARTKTPSYRFKVAEQPVFFNDGLLGPQHYPPGYGGDFVIRRADDIYAYQLAVVADDAAMGITDVVRGSDLLDSTPRQLLLYEALNRPLPAFTHIPLLYMDQAEKISKRHSRGATSIIRMREAGVSSQSLIGWIAYLYGQLPAPEPLSARELIDHFLWENVPRDPIVVPDNLLEKLYGRI